MALQARNDPSLAMWYSFTEFPGIIFARLLKLPSFLAGLGHLVFTRLGKIGLVALQTGPYAPAARLDAFTEFVDIGLASAFPLGRRHFPVLVLRQADDRHKEQCRD
jgi:hypothetical protein